MQPKVLHSGARGAAVGGLDWRAITSQKKPVKWAREFRKKSDFTHFVVADAATGHGAIGLYSSLLEEQSKPPKGAYSAALAFAAKVGADFPNAALVLRLDGVADQLYVVVLDDGLPSNDLIADATAAARLVDGDRQIFANMEELGTGAMPASLEWLEESADSARFRKLPVNVLALVLVVAVVLGAVGGYAAYKHQQRVEAERRAAEEARKLDPTPRYMAALAVQRGMVAASRADLLEVARKLFAHPTLARGWMLEAIDCDASAGACVAKWQRRGGTYADLKAAMPGHELVPVIERGANAPDLERATTRYAVTVKRGPLAADAAKPLPKTAAQVMELGGLLQVWKTAKLRVEQGPTVLWPAVIGVPGDFQNPAALVRSPIVIAEVPGPFVGEVIASAPWFIGWDAISVAVSQGSDPASRIKFTLKGSVYAAQ